MKRIYLSEKDKKIIGLCGGIGEAFDIDPVIVRLTLIFLCLITACLPLIITYFLAWFVVPKKPPAQ